MATKRKDPHAVALGKKGGEARAKKLSKARQVEIAKRAIAARWAQKKQSTKKQ